MVKTPDEIVLIRKSGRLLASVFEMLDEIDLVGMSTMQINDLVERYITVDLAARPASKGQYGFQFVLNCSINDVVCHGVPDPRQFVRDGDLITLDANAGVLDCDISETELLSRPEREYFERSEDVGRNLFAGFRTLVTSAEQGACTLFPALLPETER